MKKITKITAVFATAVATLSLAACGPEDETDNVEIPDYSEYASEKVNDGSAWVDAFDFSDMYNGSVVLDWIGAENDTTGSGPTHVVYKLDGKKLYSDLTIKNQTVYQTQKSYQDLDAEYGYMWNENTDEWEKIKMPNDVPSELSFNALLMSVIDQDIFKDEIGDVSSFDLFVYDDDKAAYVYYPVENYKGTFYTVKIKDGKICYIELTVGDRDSYRILIYDLGTTVVTLPTV